MADKLITDPGVINQILNALPVSYKYGSSTMYRLPVNTIELKKSSAGNVTYTITLCKVKGNNEVHVNYFELFTYAQVSTQHNLNGFVKICFCPSGTVTTNFAAICAGSFSNVRLIESAGERYIGADIEVNQYGYCILKILGLHEDITEIKNVTGNFSEIE